VANDYLIIENELQKRAAQSESVRGTDCPFRVEFRYKAGTKHWQYFTNLEDAQRADDSSCSYGPTGRAVIERPTSLVIQIRGPKGGWSKVRICSLCGRRPSDPSCPVLVDECNEDACKTCYLELRHRP